MYHASSVKLSLCLEAMLVTCSSVNRWASARLSYFGNSATQQGQLVGGRNIVGGHPKRDSHLLILQPHIALGLNAESNYEEKACNLLTFSNSFLKQVLSVRLSSSSNLESGLQKDVL